MLGYRGGGDGFAKRWPDAFVQRLFAVARAAALLGASPAPPPDARARAPPATPTPATRRWRRPTSTSRSGPRPVSATLRRGPRLRRAAGLVRRRRLGARSSARDRRYLDRLAAIDAGHALAARPARRGDAGQRPARRPAAQRHDGVVAPQARPATCSSPAAACSSWSRAPSPRPAVRLRAAIAREMALPRLFAQARANLTGGRPRHRRRSRSTTRSARSRCCRPPFRSAFAGAGDARAAGAPARAPPPSRSRPPGLRALPAQPLGRPSQRQLRHRRGRLRRAAEVRRGHRHAARPLPGGRREGAGADAPRAGRDRQADRSPRVHRSRCWPGIYRAAPERRAG